MPAAAAIAAYACGSACVSACSVAPVTFTPLGDSAPDATPSGADAALDAPAAVPASCKALHAAQPALPTGSYQIDPDGAGGDPPVTVPCDMETDGGGWTIVFVAPTTNFMATPIDYTAGTPRLMEDAQSALIAYRTATLASYPDHARFGLPDPWRATPPFNVDGTDLMLDVSIAGGTPAQAKLRYGRHTFSMTCNDSWVTDFQWGRICIEDTKAPFYSGFTHPTVDFCPDSRSRFDAAACTDDRRFSIAVR